MSTAYLRPATLVPLLLLASLLAVPFVAIVVFPAAAAGSTLLARELLGTDRSTPESASADQNRRS